MMKYLPLFVTLLLISACESPQNQTALTSVAKDDKSISSPSTPSTPSADPSSRHELRIVVDTANNFDSTGLALLEKARSLLERVVNSEEFKQQILSFSYNGAKEFVQNNGLTNQQIYDTIMSGAEQYPSKTALDHTMNLNLERYYSNTNTIGYTNLGTKIVYVNGNYFDYFNASEVADNMMHEWLHKMGFDHDADVTDRRRYSVPYAIGYIAEDLVAELM